MVEADASRHEAAKHFGISVSSVVRRMQRWNESGSAAPNISGAPERANLDDSGMLYCPPPVAGPQKENFTPR
jgi:transposase